MIDSPCAGQQSNPVLALPSFTWVAKAELLSASPRRFALCTGLQYGCRVRSVGDAVWLIVRFNLLSRDDRLEKNDCRYLQHLSGRCIQPYQY